METYKDDLKEHLLVNLHELLVPLLNLGGLAACVRVLVLGLKGVVAVMLAPFNDLPQHRLVDLKARGLVSKILPCQCSGRT